MLQDADVTEEFDNVYNSLKSRNKYNNNFAEWWSFDVKNKIRQFYKSKFFEFSNRNRTQKDLCYAKLKQLEIKQMNGQNVSDELAKTKSDIINIETNRLKSISSNFKPNTMLENEKMGIYQVSKIVKMQSNPNVLQLKNDKGVLCDQLETKQIVYDHYKDLFAGRHDNVAADCMLNSLTKVLSANSKQDLIEPITENELLDTIKRCTLKKAPGPDGITYEFYLVHYTTLKTDLLKLFNGIFNGSVKPLESFSDGIVTLIPKIGNKNDINNYRPISLLNTDYKLLCKIIANRLKKCLEEIIDEGQTAGIKNKSCTDNLDIIRTLVIKAQQSKNSNLLCSV